MSDLNNTLRDTPFASSVRVPSRVILHRTELNTREIDGIQRVGVYGPIPKGERICELEVGGQILARGRIVKTYGRHFFKVTEAG